MSRQLIVAGFHRSGTSLVSQLLHRAGLFMGFELLGAMPSNAFGHFEDVDVVRLHERLLADNGLTWHVTEPVIPYVAPERWTAMEQLIARRQEHTRLWGFKDPRLCLFLPLWKYLLPDAKVVVVYRHFAESVASLERRHSADLFARRGPASLHRLFWEDPDHALKMWVEGNQGLLAHARAHPDDTLVLSFDDVRDGYPLVHQVNERWRLGLAEIDAVEVFDAAVTQRRPGRQPVADPAVGRRATSTWQQLERLAAPAPAGTGSGDV